MLDTRASPRKIPFPISTFFIYPVLRSVFFIRMFINFLVLSSNLKQLCEQIGISFSPNNRLPGNLSLNFIKASYCLRNETPTISSCFIGKVSSTTWKGISFLVKKLQSHHMYEWHPYQFLLNHRFLLSLFLRLVLMHILLQNLTVSLYQLHSSITKIIVKESMV